jgi:general nucleoside transport system permease protein
MGIMSVAATPDVAAGPAAATELSPVELTRLRNIGITIVVAGLVCLYLFFKTDSGKAAFKLNNELVPDKQWIVHLPGKGTVLVCALLLIALGAAQIMRRWSGRTLVWVSVAAGLLFLLAFLCWADAGKAFPFPLEAQFWGTMKFATPLILGALAGVCCERAGVINVAIEGQFLAAAFAAAVIGTIFDSAIIGIVGGVLAGMLIGWLLAVFSIRYLVNQVVLGVVLVLLATGLTGFLLDQIPSTKTADLNAPPVLSPIAIPGLSDIPLIGRALFEQSIIVYIMYVSVFLVAFVLFETRWGLRVRAVGEHPLAADTVGIKVKRTRYQAVLVGAVFAGLGGAYFTVGSTGAFDKEQTAGNGFIALAAVIMGRWHPIGATLGAIFFGFMLQLAQALQILQTPIPSEFLNAVPYAATIVAVAGLVGRVRPPAADGEPYVKS